MKRWGLVIVAIAPLAACASNSTSRSSGYDERSAMDRTGSAVGSAARQTYRGVGDAVTSPLRDLNLTRRDIPVVLLAATDNPYQTRTVFDCQSIAAEVAALDLALGPDLDTPTFEKETDYYRQGADEAAEAALDAARDAAEGLVPFRSWVRQISGAKSNEKRVKEAIYAGAVRRAFLKGIGEHRGCAAPAAPLEDWYERQARGESAAADGAQTGDARTGEAQPATATEPAATPPG